MAGKSRMLVLGASVAGILAAGTVAVAQGSPNPTSTAATAEARLAWAKRHVELVCRPLEAQRMFDKATRCYNDVARLMGASTPEKPAATAERSAPAPKPAAENTAPTPTAPSAAPAPERPKPSARPAPVRTAVAPRPAPARVAATPRPAPAPRAITVAQNEVRPAASRCTGVGCLRYTLLGVGF